MGVYKGVPLVKRIRQNGKKSAERRRLANVRPMFGPGGLARAVEPEIKTGNLKRLRRIEGQVRGLQQMVQQERYCADILVQIAAVQQALRAVSRELWQNHLQHCVSHALRAGGRPARAMSAELIQLSHLCQ